MTARIVAGIGLGLALAACGDGGTTTPPMADAAIDAGTPAPPTLGAQLDRMGRAAINTTLIAVLAPDGAAKTAQKDTYDRAGDPAAWRTTSLRTNVTVEQELKANLAVFDALDLGLATPVAGCGSALRYAGPPNNASYQGAADLFADDQLYVDTSKATCSVYLALEIEYASAGQFIHAACGGRTLRHDAIDATYSVLMSGVAGLDPAGDFSPRLHDGVGPHADVSDAFPFLGPPH